MPAPRVLVRHERLVITAAHCLPTGGDGYLQMPPPHPARHVGEQTYRNWLGSLGGKPTVSAECLFVDPVADVAVFGEPDGQAFFKEADAYTALVGTRRPLGIGPVAGTPERPQTAWLLSLAGTWLQCKVHQFQRRSGLTIDADPKGYAAGTSGSPVITSDGQAIGVISLGADGNPVLVNNLPGWALRELDSDEK